MQTPLMSFCLLPSLAQVYYVYGFMLLVFLILLIVTVCVAIVASYFLLNAENYHWQVPHVDPTQHDPRSCSVCFQSLTYMMS
jgi:hypothetical protein